MSNNEAIRELLSLIKSDSDKIQETVNELYKIIKEGYEDKKAKNI